jgi:hypothetical protein
MSGGRSEPPGYTFRYDLARRRLFVSGRHFERDLLGVGALVRKGLIPVDLDAVVYVDSACRVVSIIRNRVLHALFAEWALRSA